MRPLVFRVVAGLFFASCLAQFSCSTGSISWSKAGEKADLKREPELRIGLAESAGSIAFETFTTASLYERGGVLLAANLPAGTWKAVLAKAKSKAGPYRLRYATAPSLNEARRKRLELHAMHIYPVILERKEAVNSRGLQARTLYDISIRKEFETRAEAEREQAKLAEKARLEIYSPAKNSGGGQLELTVEPGSRTFTSTKGFRIASERFSLQNVEVGKGFHWSRTERRTYRGQIAVFSAGGGVTAINITALETYLRGVVPSEMQSRFPIAALRSQAVAARSTAVHVLHSGRHRESQFDICATVHCQVYSGLDNESARTDSAVADTRGEVVALHGDPVEAVYNAVCGGHTESNENVWDGNARSHLRGRFDGDGRPGFLKDYLTKSDYVGRWVRSRGPAYCNLEAESLPPALAYARKYYRWRVETSARALAARIKEAVGVDVGVVRDIVPLQRGISGRLRRVRVEGTERDVVLEKELPIRQALGERTLYSSCFVVEKRRGSGGQPASFVFLGAGWGHGVGMCQIGAATMARAGSGRAAILSHYYKGTSTKRLY